MTSRYSLPFIALALAVVLLTSEPLVIACGPFSLEAIFVFTVHPEYPLANFARGEIGVVQPSYARSYLYVAYRHLSGLGFSEMEQQALTELWKDRLDYSWTVGEQDWIQQWTAARGKVSGLNPPAPIEVYRHREKPNEYETYLNCQKDAFVTAAATLGARINKFGADSSAVKEWVAAQDQVFANCSAGQQIPSSDAGNADQLARADRNYQIAAANFYAGNFDEAKKLFAAIAMEDGSPWRDNAPYLIARALVRKASLGSAETRKPALTDAEAQLKNILKDRKLTALHEAADRLLSMVRLRLYPETRLHELAQSLVAKHPGSGLKQKLWDYTVLLDQFIGEEPSGHSEALSQVLKADDLTDWVVTFEGSDPVTVEHSLQRWQATQALPWLVAALSKVNAKHAQAAELMVQAAKVAPDSPAYPTAVFHLLRLKVEAGKVEEARHLVDQSLEQHRSAFNRSSLNLLLSLRMGLATNLDEFLKLAQRLPAGLSWNDDGREIPIDPKDEDESSRALEGKILFDSDGARIFNQRMPVAMLKQTVENSALPVHLRRDIAQAAWLRAILLTDYTTANQLIPTLKELVPEASSLLEGFDTATQPDAKRFAGLYAWLKLPGFEPVVDAGVGRRTALADQDPYRDNWWCSAAFPPAAAVAGAEDPDKRKPVFKIDSNTLPVFLTQTQKATAATQYATLMGIGAAPNYLCREVIQWAASNPEDSRVAEALHLAVKSTRYGCTNKETGRWSKAAYDLLHGRYPNTIWAKRTPYWFQD